MHARIPNGARTAFACALSVLVTVMLFAEPAIAKPTPEGYTQTGRLLAPDAAQADGFGYSVALDAQTALVGAYRNDLAAIDAGAAYVFENTAEGWSDGVALRPVGIGYDDRFGQAVGVSGNRLIVGAPRDDDLGTDCGASYVYERTAEGWMLDAKLLPTGGISFGRVGATVDIDGDTAVMAGGRKVYVYVFTAEGWVLQATLTSPAGVYDYFGCSIAISGDTVVVGAHGFDSIYNEGRAYVFVREGGTWSLQATLAATDGEPNDQFGFGLALDGDTALIGAWGDDDAGSSAGAAYAYERAGATWTQVAKLVPPDAEAFDYIGYHVDIDGDIAAVSAHHDADAGFDAGATHVFDRTAGWARVAKLLADDAAAGDLFGNPSVSAGRVLVGAYGSDAAAPDAGAAYIFETADDTRPGPGPGGTGPGRAAVTGW